VAVRRHTGRDICRLFDYLQLDLIQLHGDQQPEFLPHWLSPVIGLPRRADGLRSVAAYLDRCRELGKGVTMVLIDSLLWGVRGTGTVADWSVPKPMGGTGRPPLVLAADSPGERRRGDSDGWPAAVDVASGSSLGRAAKIRPGRSIHSATRIAFRG